MSSTSPSGVDETATQRGFPLTEIGTAISPVRSPSISSVADETCPLDTAAAAAGELGRIAVRLSCESTTTTFEPSEPGLTPRIVTLASLRWAASLASRRICACDAPWRIALSRRALSAVATSSSRWSFCAVRFDRSCGTTYR